MLELVHGALCVCGRDPEPELLMPFHLFTKHWTLLLRHHFPDHYSDCLRLLMTSKWCNKHQRQNFYFILSDVILPHDVLAGTAASLYEMCCIKR